MVRVCHNNHGNIVCYSQGQYMEKDDKATVFNETKKYATGNKFLPAINYIYSILIVLFTRL